MKMTAQKHCR